MTTKSKHAAQQAASGPTDGIQVVEEFESATAEVLAHPMPAPVIERTPAPTPPATSPGTEGADTPRTTGATHA